MRRRSALELQIDRRAPCRARLRFVARLGRVGGALALGPEREGRVRRQHLENVLEIRDVVGRDAQLGAGCEDAREGWDFVQTFYEHHPDAPPVQQSGPAE